jgi:hypothetical protein
MEQSRARQQAVAGIGKSPAVEAKNRMTHLSTFWIKVTPPASGSTTLSSDIPGIQCPAAKNK